MLSRAEERIAGGSPVHSADRQALRQGMLKISEEYRARGHIHAG